MEDILAYIFIGFLGVFALLVSRYSSSGPYTIDKQLADEEAEKRGDEFGKAFRIASLVGFILVQILMWGYVFFVALTNEQTDSPVKYEKQMELNKLDEEVK